jgi:AraC family transcriptional regulator, regulatory protein of adaptative response / methylated-DNA-[protein]-cysteine methyltransferase
MPTDYARVGNALRFIHEHARQQPSLEETAAAAKLSAFHFQRLFRRYVGVSPKRYLQHLTAVSARQALLGDATVLEATYDVGLSGPARLHDLFVAVEAVTPGEVRDGGASLEIRYGVHWTPLGPCCLSLTGRGICDLRFLDSPDPGLAARELSARWPRAALCEAPEVTGEIAYRIFHGRQWRDERPFHLHLQGTNFQVQVWRALLGIPAGETRSYAGVATGMGRPASHARAVAGAVAANPVSVLIPCHRVIRGGGTLGGYRWGLERKQRLLDGEERRAKS